MWWWDFPFWFNLVDVVQAAGFTWVEGQSSDLQGMASGSAGCCLPEQGFCQWVWPLVEMKLWVCFWGWGEEGQLGIDWAVTEGVGGLPGFCPLPPHGLWWSWGQGLTEFNSELCGTRLFFVGTLLPLQCLLCICWSCFYIFKFKFGRSYVSNNLSISWPLCSVH